jgi:hypothetical protein
MLLALSDGFLRPQADDPGGSLGLLRALAQSTLTAEAVIARLDDLAAQVKGPECDDQSAMVIQFQIM